MGIPFIIGASQQKRQRILGFETYCAPDNFDRTAQPVDIYDVFERYYRTNANAKFIYSVINSAISTTLASGTSYRWAETVSGVETITDVTSGTITWTTGSTKRWVIVNHTTTSSINATIGHIYAEWLYCGNKISSAGQGHNQPNLKYIHIDKLDNITSYPYSAHYGNVLTGTLHISKTPTEIPTLAFYGGTRLTGTLEIPSNIKRINYYAGQAGAFAHCSGLTTLILNEGLEYIAPGAFSGCTGLDGTLTIPNTCTEIGASAFDSCNKLDTLDLGTGVITIGTRAFYRCTSFTGTLTIPANITSIGQGAFGDDNFSDIDVTANSRYEDVDDVLYEISTRTALHSVKGNTGTLTFQSNTLIIGDYCCLRNLRTGTLTVPDSVTKVGGAAFYDCNGFTAISLETTASALVTIGVDAFSEMTAVTGNLVIPNSVETIGANAFYNNTAQTGTLTLGTGLKTIGASAFYNNPFTGTLNIPASVTAIGESAFAFNNFSSITNSSTNFDVSDNVLYDLSVAGQVKANISAKAYTGTLTLRSDTTQILDYCFANNSNRSGSLTFPNTLVEIRVGSFQNCTGFSGDLIFPAALATIGRNGWQSNTFYGCTGFWDSLIINNPNIWIGTYGNPILMTNIGRTSGGVQLPANYASSWLGFDASPYLSAATLNQSIINITSGTKTLRIGATNKARLIAAYPNAVTDAAARGITIV